MRKVVKYASFVFNALCWALMASVMMYSNTPLQMWLNLGLLFWGVLVIATVLLIIFNRKNEYGIGIRGSFVSFWTMILVGLVYMGPTGKWFVRPAQIIREGFNAWWPFPVINTILVILFPNLLLNGTSLFLILFPNTNVSKCFFFFFYKLLASCTLCCPSLSKVTTI